jgi:hypothetical protein
VAEAVEKRLVRAHRTARVDLEVVTYAVDQHDTRLSDLEDCVFGKEGQVIGLTEKERNRAKIDRIITWVATILLAAVLTTVVGVWMRPWTIGPGYDDSEIEQLKARIDRLEKRLQIHGIPVPQ